MKTRSAGLITHHGEAVQTRAWCWKVTRRDAQVFGFTSLDANLVIDDVTYEASTGFTPSAIDGKADLSVPNLDVTGLLDSASITEDDLLAGRWDGAAVEIFELNFKDLTQGAMNLRTGTIGNISAGRTMFTAELRGLAQHLQQPVGELFAPSCSATLGDARCKVALGPITVAGTVTSAASARSFADSARSEADDWFGSGLINWTSGFNVGLSMEVRDYTLAGGAFVLSLPMPYIVQVGDTYNAVPGCRKRHARSALYDPIGVSDCKDKFNNVVNFRGHPFAPGNDKVLGNAALASI